MRRLVIDANVLLSALVGNQEAAPARLLEAVHDDAVEMLACPALIAAVRENLDEPYFKALLDPAEAGRAVVALEHAATMLDDPPDPQPVLRDQSDNYLVALARTAEAEMIITGDKDLLEHDGLQPQAITPRQACQLLGLADSHRG